jgi:putative addiction module killer protein
MDVRHYFTQTHIEPFQEWLDALEDRAGRIVILRRSDRLRRGHLGDCKFCGEGVWELRIDYGPGYRLYYAMLDQTTLLMLCGGSKRSQASDIARAIAYWRDFQGRQHD